MAADQSRRLIRIQEFLDVLKRVERAQVGLGTTTDSLAMTQAMILEAQAQIQAAHDAIALVNGEMTSTAEATAENAAKVEAAAKKADDATAANAATATKVADAAKKADDASIEIQSISEDINAMAIELGSRLNSVDAFVTLLSRLMPIQIARLQANAAGVVTWTFPQAYTTIPVVLALAEDSGRPVSVQITTPGKDKVVLLARRAKVLQLTISTLTNVDVYEAASGIYLHLIAFAVKS